MSDINIGTMFKLNESKYPWYVEFRNRVFVVCEGYDPNHFQIPAMTQYGRTWFDRDAVTILEDVEQLDER